MEKGAQKVGYVVPLEGKQARLVARAKSCRLCPETIESWGCALWLPPPSEPAGFSLKLPVFVAFGMTAFAVGRNRHPAPGAIFTAVVDSVLDDGLARFNGASTTGMCANLTPHCFLPSRAQAYGAGSPYFTRCMRISYST